MNAALKSNFFDMVHKIVLNTSVQIIGKIISLVLSIATIALLTRSLGLTGYGEFTLAFSYVSFFGLFTDFGLQLTVIRELGENLETRPTVYGTFFALKMALVFVSICLALICMLFFPYDLSMKMAIILASITVALGNLNGFPTAIFQYKLRLDIITFGDVLAKVVTFIFIFLGAFYFHSVYYMISAVLIGNFFLIIYSFLFLHKLGVKKFLFKRSLVFDLIRFSLPVGAASFFSLAAIQVATIILSIRSGTQAVGVYSLSYKFIDNILIIWGFYMASIYPLLSQLRGNKDSVNTGRIITGSVFFAVASSLPAIGIGVVFAPLVVYIFGGGHFAASILPLRILLFSLPFAFLNNFFYHVLILDKRYKALIYSFAVKFILIVFANFIIIPQWGYTGTASIAVFSELFLSLYLFFYTNSVHHLSWRENMNSLLAKIHI